jgi:NADPH:quinone reductase-like Zn-dependent oxidoreductase
MKFRMFPKHNLRSFFMLYKHVVATQYGGPEVLQVLEDEVPEPKVNEVRVKVLTTTAAFTDVLIREGFYPGVPKPPFSPGYAIVAVVDRLGSQTTGLALGQRVAALTVTGGYSEYLCLPVSELVLVPDGIDSDEAVCLILQYVTAYQILHRIAKVKSGDSILVHGAAGGVGTAVLELGRLVGLKMYGTASSAKQELIRRMGGIPIDYRQDDFLQRIHALTAEGVDVVLDGIGGMHFLRSYQALRPAGQLISYGFSGLRHQQGRWLKLAASFGLLALLKYWPNGRKATFYSITTLKQKHPDWFREDLTHLFNLLVQRKIEPVISDRLPLTEAKQAHEWLAQSAVEGQLVLLC